MSDDEKQCPECLKLVDPNELIVFSGVCESCAEELDNEFSAGE